MSKTLYIRPLPDDVAEVLERYKQEEGIKVNTDAAVAIIRNHFHLAKLHSMLQQSLKDTLAREKHLKEELATFLQAFSNLQKLSNE